MKQVDVFLTRKAQAVWSSAVVYKEELPAKGELGPRTHFLLELAGKETIDLGGPFGVARQALYVLRDAVRGTTQK